MRPVYVWEKGVPEIGVGQPRVGYYEGISPTGLPPGRKVGITKARLVLRTYAFGADASIRTAVRNAGITRVHTVDMRTFNLFNLYTTFTTVVTGE